jgi:hypothetical protein
VLDRAVGKAGPAGSHPASDWDFYGVVDRNLEFSEREDLASAIFWTPAQEEIFADVWS